jgi:hypothetical protein
MLKPLFDAEELRPASTQFTEDSPAWHCCACDHEWDIHHLAPLLESLRNARIGAISSEPKTIQNQSSDVLDA